ncbi:Kinase [Hexamita inflata]|uniref:CAMK CAMK1 n=1 Tax=Hexamita inflata TaxID=28002 RepID=A0AA86Q0I8_9EUKA|nr:CAMK CAMK1 [Hexamita inflata]CAI9974554.1 CAMK CAMK1 [Hexamita inflata]
MSAEDFVMSSKVLGKGAFGVVYEGVQRVTNIPVAIKVIPKEKADFKLLSREIGIIKRCDHENIIKFYACYEDATSVHIVTELARGGELFDHIIKRKRYSEEDARAIIKQVVAALCYLHQNKVAHLDLKPENLLLKEVPENYDQQTSKFVPCVKVADFGTSVVFRGKTERAAVGTPGYVAPEVLQQKEYTTQPDIYALGVITYVLLAGHLPFDDSDLKKMLKQQVRGQWEFSKRFDKVSENAKDFIKKCMGLDYEARPTAVVLLKHPWIQQGQITEVDLVESTADLRKYIASMRLKAGFQAVAVAMRLANMEKYLKEIEDEK